MSIDKKQAREGARRLVSYLLNETAKALEDGEAMPESEIRAVVQDAVIEYGRYWMAAAGVIRLRPVEREDGRLDFENVWIDDAAAHCPYLSREELDAMLTDAIDNLPDAVVH